MAWGGNNEQDFTVQMCTFHVILANIKFWNLTPTSSPTPWGGGYMTCLHRSRHLNQFIAKFFREWILTPPHWGGALGKMISIPIWKFHKPPRGSIFIHDIHPMVVGFQTLLFCADII